MGMYVLLCGSLTLMMLSSMAFLLGSVEQSEWERRDTMPVFSHLNLCT